MYRVHLPIAGSSKETGALLTEYLETRGVKIDAASDIVISYGVPGFDKDHVLNRLHGRGKTYNMTLMNEGGVRTVPWFTGSIHNLPKDFRFPALARKIHGYGGTDIVPVFEPCEIEWRQRAGWDWFSTYIPIDQEFRVWVYRDEVLDVYRKVMTRPDEYKYIGRNFRNGFEFQHTTKNIADASEMGLKTLKALGYDFAAIDMLRGRDGLIYILESNSAPGVLRSKAETTLGKLADRMKDWLIDGCPNWKK